MVQTFKHSTQRANQSKSLKLLSQRVRNRYYKTLGTSGITAHFPLSISVMGHGNFHKIIKPSLIAMSYVNLYFYTEQTLDIAE